MNTDKNDNRGHNAAKKPGEVGFQPIKKAEAAQKSLGSMSDEHKMFTRAVGAIQGWDVAVAFDDVEPEDFDAIYNVAIDIRNAGGPFAERASVALDQYEKGLAWANRNDKDVPVDDEQVVIDVVRDYVADCEADGSAPDDWEITGEERRTIRDQIGMMNILAISGGKITPLKDGIELPVGYGYRVRVRLTPADDYTVERVFVRGGKEWSYGKRDRVYADEVGNMAYWASCYNNDSGKEWTYMGQ